MAASPLARGIGSGYLVARRYEILDTLGSGGMATVFKAHDRALDVDVALKVLKDSPTRNLELAVRFRSEIKLARLVRHRNVCGIHEYGEDGDLLYISMELIDGKDLKRLLRDQGPLDWAQAYDVAIQIGEGLEAIHEAGVIHRDLKPANITRDARGLVRLMDFGIAKVWGEDSGAGATRDGHVVGSPEYMSPEQVRGTSLDFRSDLYSLGLVIYELFTGSTPFRGETPAAVMLQRLERQPDLDGPAAERIPPAAVPILRKALAREPAGRYASCGELLVGLRAARAALWLETTGAMAPRNGHHTGDESVDASGVPPVPIFSRQAQARLLLRPLLKALKHADKGVRLGAVQALGRLAGDALLVGPASRPAAEALAAARREDDDERVRAGAARALAQLEPPVPTTPLPPARSEPAPQTSPEPTRTNDREPLPAPAAKRGSSRVTWLVRLAIAALLPAAVAVAWMSGLLTPAPPLTAPAESSAIPPDATQLSSPAITAPPPASTAPAEIQPTELPPPTMARVVPPSTTRAIAAKPPAPKPVASPPPSEPSPAPTPELSAATPSPLPTLEPTPMPEIVSETPTVTEPVPTQAPVVVPAACLSCPIPEAVRVLRERLDLARAVRLRIHVSDTGDVLRVDYVAGPAPVRDAITKAAMRWRYRPARRDDRPVASFVQIDIEL